MGILASLELEVDDGERLRIKDVFWDTSATQSARRIRTGMILLAITQGQGFVAPNFTNPIQAAKFDSDVDRLSFIIYYAGTVFEKYLTLPRLTASALSGAVTTSITIAAWITVPLIEKAGRRKWLITGACLQTIFLAIVTGLSSHPDYANSAAAAAFLFAFAAVLGATWVPFPVNLPFSVPPKYRVL